MTEQSTESIYDANATSWTRQDRLLLSDFTARPAVIEELRPLPGSHVLDLGCGEGYVARLVAGAGAASVYGIDVSSEMVHNAQASTPEAGACDLRFAVGDAATLTDLPRHTYERVMAVFLFNYLTRAEMTAVMRTVRRALAPGGRFVFTVPHPCFPYLRPPAEPFYFDTDGAGYFAGVDHTFEGRIWRRDGVAVPVRCVHKTFGDYFTALADAGFDRLPKVVELHVTDEHLALDPGFFGPLSGQPLHVLFRVEVP